MYNNSIINIIGVDRMRWKGGVFDIKPRSYSALAFRVYGKAVITAKDKRYIINEEELLYLPQNISYKAEYSDTEIIVIHFQALNDDKEPLLFHMNERAAIYELFSKILDLWINKNTLRRFAIMSMTYELLTMVCEKDIQDNLPPCLNKAVLFINLNYKKSNISINEVCKYSGISPTYLRMMFKKYFFKAPNEYINDLRLENAKKMILNGAKVSAAALESGFNDSKYFSRIVKKRFGCTPCELKNFGK